MSAMLPTNPERFESLRKLTPIKAVKAWMEGDFGIGDEPALLEAIRKDKRITLSDEQIEDIMADAMDDEGADPQKYLSLLAQKS